MAHEDSSQDDHKELPTSPPFDRVVFGRLVRAARVIAGFDTIGELAASILETQGMHLSDRTLYAIERGDQEPTVSQYIAIVQALNPPGGAVYWDRCLRPDIAAYFQNRRPGGDG